MLQKAVYKDGHTRLYDLVAEQLSVLNTAEQSVTEGWKESQSVAEWFRSVFV